MNSVQTRIARIIVDSQFEQDLNFSVIEGTHAHLL